MLRSLTVSILILGGALTLFQVLPTLTVLLGLGGLAVGVLLLAVLTSAFHRPAEGRDRLLRA